MYTPSKLQHWPKVGFSVGLLIDIFFSILYFLEIKYFPITDLQSLLYLPVIIAILGLLFLFGLIFPLGYGLYEWSQLLKRRDICELIVSSANAETVIEGFKKNHFDFHVNIRKWICIFYTGVMLLSYLIIYCLAQADSLRTLYLYFIFGFIAHYYLQFSDYKRSGGSHAVHTIEKQNKAFTSLIFLLYSIYPSLFILFPLFILLKLAVIEPGYLAYIFYSAVVLMTSICFVPPSEDWKFTNWIATVSFASVLFLLAYFGGFYELSASIMRTLKFGAIKNVTITFDQTACEVFQYIKNDLACSKKKLVYQLENVDVLWRVGEYYFRFEHPKGKMHSIIIPSKNIIAIEHTID